MLSNCHITEKLSVNFNVNKVVARSEHESSIKPDSGVWFIRPEIMSAFLYIFCSLQAAMLPSPELPTLEKSDSLGTKSRRKQLWDYLGGRRSKQTRRNLVRNVIAWIGFRTTDSNKIEVIVLDDQKSRELRRIRATCLAVYLDDCTIL